MTNQPSILLTGGAGYIGSHTFVALVKAGFTPIILDDFSNSKPAVLERLQRITGQPVQCQQGNVADVAQCYADSTLAQRLLNWRAKHTLVDMCADAWRWQSSNPDGYV